MMIFVFEKLRFRLMRDATAKPSMSGMFASRIASENGRPASAARLSASRADGPFSATKGFIRQARSISERICLLVALSSTASTVRPRKAERSAPIFFADASSNDAVKLNVLP